MELMRAEAQEEFLHGASPATDEAMDVGNPHTTLTSAHSAYARTPKEEKTKEKANDKAREKANEKKAAEAETEKRRLQGLVHSFAKKAYKGIPCTYLDVAAGARVKTTYKINKVLTHLTIMSVESKDVPEVTCPIASIQDVYSLEEDGESVFPKELLQMLKRGEDQRLLMFVCLTDKGQWQKLCFLEESRESKIALLECLRILCLYAITTPTQEPAVKQATVLPTAAAGGA